MDMFPVLVKVLFSLFDAYVSCPCKGRLLIVWWRCVLSYISSSSRCLMEMFPVLVKVLFSLFDVDVSCPSKGPLLGV